LGYAFNSVTVDGTPVDPPDTYEIAAVEPEEDPADDDYHPGPWLAGPLTAGTFALYVRFDDATERPVRHVGWLLIT
jgi:hypothetical protein